LGSPLMKRGASREFLFGGDGREETGEEGWERKLKDFIAWRRPSNVPPRRFFWGMKWEVMKKTTDVQRWWGGDAGGSFCKRIFFGRGGHFQKRRERTKEGQTKEGVFAKKGEGVPSIWLQGVGDLGIVAMEEVYGGGKTGSRPFTF